jgi:hypothetical protein
VNEDLQKILATMAIEQVFKVTPEHFVFILPNIHYYRIRSKDFSETVIMLAEYRTVDPPSQLYLGWDKDTKTVYIGSLL